LILVGGAWLAARPGRDSDRQTQAAELQARRDHLFSQLTDLEQQQQKGAVDPDRYAERRRELIGELERVYAKLDEEAAA
jgi:hypothetical protein